MADVNEVKTKDDEAERILLARRSLGDKEWGSMSDEERDAWKRTIFPGYEFALTDDEIEAVLNDDRVPVHHDQVQEVQEKANVGMSDITTFLRGMHNVKEKPSAHGNLLVGKVDNFTVRCRLAVGEDAVVRNTAVEVSVSYDKSDEIYKMHTMGIAHDRDDVSQVTLYDGSDRVEQETFENDVLGSELSTGDVNQDMNNAEIKEISDESSLD